MENGTFQINNLSHLNFDSDDFLEKTKDQLLNRANEDKPVAFPNTSPHTFQALLSQNEDLVARLRASLQKQAHLEQNAHELEQGLNQWRSQNSALNDQLLIWKEKERIWKEKESGYETIFQGKTKKLEIDNDLLRQRLKQTEIAEEELERYKKYHEKIKTSVRPYIQRLKNYAKSLLEQTQSLNAELLQKDSRLSTLENLNLNLREENAKKSELLEKQKAQLISIFEDEREALKGEVQSLSGQVEVWKEKSRNLDCSLERQDELENLIVALRRSKEELIAQNNREIGLLKAQLSENQQQLTTYRMKLEDCDQQLTQARQNLETLETGKAQTLEQLTSLRFQWNLKSQECERLVISINNLEKINSDLSQRLSGRK